MLFNVLLYLLYNVHGIKIFTVQLTTVYMLMTCILIAIYSTYPVNIYVYDMRFLLIYAKNEVQRSTAYCYYYSTLYAFHFVCKL